MSKVLRSILIVLVRVGSNPRPGPAAFEPAGHFLLLLTQAKQTAEELPGTAPPVFLAAGSAVEVTL